MALRTRCIKAEKLSDDGVRISVMNNYKLGDGTLDPEIDSDMFDEWWRVLAPPKKIAWLYYYGGMPWDDFARRYSGYLTLPRIQSVLRLLIKRAQKGNVTIFGVEKKPEYSFRRLIAETCQWLDPTLTVSIE